MPVLSCGTLFCDEPLKNIIDQLRSGEIKTLTTKETKSLQGLQSIIEFVKIYNEEGSDKFNAILNRLNNPNLQGIIRANVMEKINQSISQLKNLKTIDL